ncbi:hypothetical protein N7495_007826 [Penicillium taxi]|uniref:uncharacterized protein n=1 Tax=Penicillium taxi TaxID=168475 RepID=UPI002544E6F5|nr:uncharacterized protein N7495_007826 [Penicillium taxi]KAJ5887785.1 hypothetical protein N7495_007826 [Penicillium taxi]
MRFVFDFDTLNNDSRLTQINSARRRNGKAASCEPCRLDKVRCDHALPVCTRCKHRGISSRCFYHPAPLTKRQGERKFPLAEGVPFDRTAASTVSKNSQPNKESFNSELTASSGLVPTAGRLSRKKPILSGYFGPTSFVSPLTDAVDVDLASDSQSLELEATQRVLPPYWVQKISEILLTLGDFAIIESLIRDYYVLNQSAVIPAPFVLNSLDPLRTMCKQCISIKSLDDLTASITVPIIQNTAEIFSVPPSTAGKDFHTLFTGSSIRLEIIGVICSLAGRAGYHGLSRSQLDDPTVRSQFAQKMLAASDAALYICKILTPLNDLTIWLVYENLLLSDIVNGDSSPHGWNRLGELSTDIFALGIHRDLKSSSEMPEFLLESRRRQFAAAYQLDKTIATFLGRPPRMPLRYTDCRMPLDISDEALATEDTTLTCLTEDLDSNNWNLQPLFQRSSWIRVRFIICTFRDEVLELSLQRMTPEITNSLNDISCRCHVAWESLPPHLRYTPECWNNESPVVVCLMLIISFLAYLYNEFLVQRLLAGKYNPHGSKALLSVSARILSTVLTLGTQREQMLDLRPDFTWTILLYGFPSASLLIKALQHQKRTGETFLYEGSRSALIRNLSVFISHLETTVRPDNANYALFQRASQVFSKIIDEILEPETAMVDSDPTGDSLIRIDQMNSVDDMDLLNTMDFGAVFNQWLI